jgi:hypothetical protein
VSLAITARARGNDAQARRHLEAALQIQRSLGDAWGIAYVLNDLGQAARRERELERAQAMHEESYTLWLQSGSLMGQRAALMNLAVISLERGALERSAAFTRRSLDLCREMADPSATAARCIEIAARVLQASGSAETAICLLGAATVQREALGTPIPPNELPERDGTLHAARDCISAIAFERAWESGLELTIQAAVDIAASSVAQIEESRPG